MESGPDPCVLLVHAEEGFAMPHVSRVGVASAVCVMSWPVCVVLQYGLLGDPSLISLTVSVDVKHHVYCLAVRAEEGDIVWVGVEKPRPTSVGWVWLLLSVLCPGLCVVLQDGLKRVDMVWVGVGEPHPHVSRVDVASAACYVLTSVLSCSTG